MLSWEITLEISTSDDFLDIVQSGFDAGLRLGERLEADMIAVRASAPLEQFQQKCLAVLRLEIA